MGRRQKRIGLLKSLKRERIRILNEEISEEVEEASFEYRNKNKEFFNLCDRFFIFGILANIGAVILTNALIFSKHNAVKLIESNPMTCHSYGCYLPFVVGALVLIKHIIVYGMMAYGYVLVRYNIYTNWAFYIFLAVIMAFATMTTFDFANNFGYFIGTLLFR